MSRRARLSKYADTNLDLIADIDWGWRYFWKKRGYDPPPSIGSFGSKDFDFRNEKNLAKKGKQKTTKGIPGVQEDR